MVCYRDQYTQKTQEIGTNMHFWEEDLFGQHTLQTNKKANRKSVGIYSSLHVFCYQPWVMVDLEQEEQLHINSRVTTAWSKIVTEHKLSAEAVKETEIRKILSGGELNCCSTCLTETGRSLVVLKMCYWDCMCCRGSLVHRIYVHPIHPSYKSLVLP